MAFYARADMQTKELRSSVDYLLERTVIVLDAQNSRLIGARYPLECETQVLARACIPPLERTVNTCKVLDTCISRSSVTFPPQADCMNTGCTLERGVPRSSVSPNSGKFRFEPHAQNQLLKNQIRSSWANFLENTWEPII